MWWPVLSSSNMCRVLILCGNVNMVSGVGRQNFRISYDQRNLPRRIDYLDGSHVDYTHEADGAKLWVDYDLNTYSAVLLPTDEDVACDSSACVHIWREYVGNNVYEINLYYSFDGLMVDSFLPDIFA